MGPLCWTYGLSCKDYNVCMLVCLFETGSSLYPWLGLTAGIKGHATLGTEGVIFVSVHRDSLIYSYVTG